MHTSKKSLRRQISRVLLPLVTEKAINKDNGAFSHPVSRVLSVNASRTTANGQTERKTRLYAQPIGSLLYLIGAARHGPRTTVNCGFVMLLHPKVAPANGGNELNGFARKIASFSDSFWILGGLRRAHHARFFPNIRHNFSTNELAPAVVQRFEHIK